MTAAIEKARNRGSAAKLSGNQTILFIFVDDEGASPWTTELRGPVEIKIEQAMRWLESQAKKRGVDLRIESRCLPIGSAAFRLGVRIDESDYAAGPGHSTWYNYVATGLTSWGSLAERWDELFRLARIPVKRSDGSAIFFCVRRYVPSVAFHFFEGQHAEFEHERGIIYDNGGWSGQIHLASLIVHEMLHLYGAVDLAPGKSDVALCEYAKDNLDDIMHTPTQWPLDQYGIGDLTSYLIGWSETKPDCLMPR